jgi:hypothetical protein
MDSILQSLLSLSFLFSCLAIAAITAGVKHTVQWFLDQPWVPTSSASKVWKELILPILPPVLGGLICFLNSAYPYPEGFDSSSARAVFGIASGLLSGLVYRVIKSILSGKISESNENVDK